MEVLFLKPDFFKSAMLFQGWGRKEAWTRRADTLLLALAVLGLGLHLLSERTRQLRPQPFLGEKMAAASRTARCYDAIRLARMGTPAAADKENDPEASGLIGQEFTLITTDRGVLEAKLTSVNPNFAAVFVQYFHQLGLKENDPVAVGLTGSFPAMNVALLCAAEEMKLRPIVITSLGSSMWGANDPAFTWLDMEGLLNQKGLLHTRSQAASLGGSNDRGRGLSPKGRSLLKDAVERSGLPLIAEPTLEQSVAKRMGIYAQEAGETPIRAYVNIGGGAASLGNQQSAMLIPPGISRRLKPYNWPQRGVLHRFAQQGTPVVNVVDVETIAQTHGLPRVPETVPPVGQGSIFYQEAYDLRVVVPALLLFLVLCFGVLRARQKVAKAAMEADMAPVLPGVAGRPVEERSGG
jgi:poly-gamma-glutamate system protein